MKHEYEDIVSMLRTNPIIVTWCFTSPRQHNIGIVGLSLGVSAYSQVFIFMLHIPS